jgi:hypothetical protein
MDLESVGVREEINALSALRGRPLQKMALILKETLEKALQSNEYWIAAAQRRRRK